MSSCRAFISKYLCEGQANKGTLDAKAQSFRSDGSSSPDESNESDPVPQNKSFAAKYGKWWPGIVVHIIWWSWMLSAPSRGSPGFELFTGESGAEQIPRWYLSVTMIFGSMLAGATSEGGAAVAFPVMTLAFGIAPPVARDFSFMIQSVGMTAAAATILWMKVLVEWKVLVYTTVGGIAGIIFGLEYCVLDPPYAKMYFVVIWGSFAASLYWLNRIEGRKVYLVLDPPHIPEIWNSATLWQLDATPGSIGSYVCVNWKALVLLATGFLGGIFSSIAGSGIDICSFAVLTLLFRVSEKTATPTSVILMSINTVVGFLYRQFGQGGVEPDAWGFLLVCAPIVCFGAPLGSVLGSMVHRLVLAWAVYITDLVQLIGALVIVEPWVKVEGKKDDPVHLTASSAAIMVSGVIFFYILTVLGNTIVEKNDELEAKNKRAAAESAKDVEVAVPDVPESSL